LRPGLLLRLRRLLLRDLSGRNLSLRCLRVRSLSLRDLRLRGVQWGAVRTGLLRGLGRVGATGLLLVPVRGRVDGSGPVLVLGTVAETVLIWCRHRRRPSHPPLAQL